MKVLVTGGNGFIGRAACRELLRQGHTPIVLDPRGRPPVTGAELRLGDVRDCVAVNEAAAHADAIIHLAGVLGTQETIANPVPAAETNIHGGLNVLQAAAESDLPTVNIGVGNWFENNTYSLTKHCVERFVDMYGRYRSGRVATVRALNAYGPGQSIAAPYGPSKVRKVTPSFVMKALRGHEIEIYGDGQQIMDMVYVDDVARVLVAALAHVTQHGYQPDLPVFEAGTGRRTTVLQIAEAVLAAAVTAGVDAKDLPSIRHLPMRPGETPGVEVRADVETMAPLAGFGVDPAAFVPLERGMVTTVQWYLDRLHDGI
jgi:UDP-glucose 4-epimerase